MIRCLPYRIYLNADDTGQAEKLFERTLSALEPFKIDKADSEPGMNIAVLAASGSRPPLVAVHSRRKHRPDRYYAQDESRCVISPGSADMAGMVILPRLEDYSGMNREKLESVFREVCLTPGDMAAVKQRLCD